MWKSKSKAWMIANNIMKEWLKDFDQKMGVVKKNIVLFLDNAGRIQKK